MRLSEEVMYQRDLENAGLQFPQPLAVTVAAEPQSGESRASVTPSGNAMCHAVSRLLRHHKCQ
jgi:hypothetical protein